MELHEYRHTDRRVTISLYDGKRLVAKARPTTAGLYIIVGYGICFLDKPKEQEKNVFGIKDPQRFVVKGADNARKIMNNLLLVEKI